MPQEDALTDAASLALAGYAVLCGLFLLAAPSLVLFACGVALPALMALALSA